MNELRGFLTETQQQIVNPGQEVIRIRKGDLVLWNGVIGRVIGIQSQFPDGSGKVLKNIKVKVDAQTMEYGRHHPDQVKRFG